ncbi:SKP1-like protein 1A [Mercurialis annua]|uniref:SKP1-like protein 1A n=1 Tax=Mercurialis annua TaxID=3986 RepID=UPI00215FF6BF|nr:SKP1-like protein 1A [Mercurialis annua]
MSTPSTATTAASAAEPSSSSPKFVELKTSDGEIFRVDEAVISPESKTIKHLIEDTCSSDENGAVTVVPLSNVTAKIMAKTVEFLKKHHEISSSQEIVSHTSTYENESDRNLADYDKEFVMEVSGDQELLFGLIMAANYLEIKSLLDVLCKAVAEMMKGKKPEEIRKTFHIVNDYTPEEEDEVRRENQWAFE